MSELVLEVVRQVEQPLVEHFDVLRLKFADGKSYVFHGDVVAKSRCKDFGHSRSRPINACNPAYGALISSREYLFFIDALFPTRTRDPKKERPIPALQLPRPLLVLVPFTGQLAPP